MPPIVLDGTTGITTPGLTNTGTETIVNLTTTGNTILGDASTDTLNVGNGGLVKNASGNVGIGTALPSSGSIVRFLQVDNATSSGLVLNAARKYSIYSSSSSTLSFLDDTAGAERMRIDSSGNLLFNSGYGSAATAYGCRAWVNFSGSGTPAIRASGNVSSITDNGVGDYTANFTNAIVDINYSAVFSASGTIGGSTYGLAAGPIGYSTTSLRLRTTMSTTFYDGDVSGAIFR